MKRLLSMFGIVHRAEDAIEAEPRDLVATIAYPARPQGIQSVSTDAIMKSQEDLLRRIKAAHRGSQAEMDEIIEPTIRGYAAFVHLLPASERHHHRGLGGLFRHGLEVGYGAMLLAESRMFGLDVVPSKRKQVAATWKAAVFTAGLLHDVGKPVSDIVVWSEDRAPWNPYMRPLATWAGEYPERPYHITWRAERHANHELLAPTIVDQVLPDNVRAYFAQVSPEIIKAFMLAVQGDPASSIYGIVAESDQASVSRDMKLNHVDEMGVGGTPLTKMFLSVVKYLVNNKWKANTPGFPLWVFNEGAFLIWPDAAKRMVTQLRDERAMGIPSDPDVVADIFIDAGLAEASDPDAPTRYWAIVPGALAEKLEGKQLMALKLVSIDTITDVIPECVEGLVFHNSRERKEAAEKGNIIPLPQRAPQSSGQAPYPPVPADNSPGAEFRSEPWEVCDTPPIEAYESDTERSVSQVDNASTSVRAVDAAKAVVEEEKKRCELDRLGALGELLRSLAEDVGSGLLRWGHEVAMYKGKVAVKYPSTVDGYGMQPSVVMNKLAKNNLLEIDLSTPQKKVIQATGFGPGGMVPEKCIVFTQGLSKEMLEISGPPKEFVPDKNQQPKKKKGKIKTGEPSALPVERASQEERQNPPETTATDNEFGLEGDAHNAEMPTTVAENATQPGPSEQSGGQAADGSSEPEEDTHNAESPAEPVESATTHDQETIESSDAEKAKAMNKAFSKAFASVLTEIGDELVEVDGKALLPLASVAALVFLSKDQQVKKNASFIANSSEENCKKLEIQGSQYVEVIRENME